MSSGGSDEEHASEHAIQSAPDLRNRCACAGLPGMNRPHDLGPDSRRSGPVRSVEHRSSGAAVEAGVRRIPSGTLFEHGAVVEIEHEGAIYRLRHTRRGKLILTK